MFLLEKYWLHFVVVQSPSHVELFETPWTAAHQASLSLTSSRSLPKFMCVKSVMESNYLIPCHPLLLLPSIFSNINVFSNDSAVRIRWPKYWSFSTSPSKENSGLIAFKIDWFHLLAFQEILKNLIQHHSSRSSILWRSAFFIVQLSQLYMTTRETIALATKSG